MKLYTLLVALLLTSIAHTDEAHLGVTEVSPVEDLMREHGVLNRVLLIYEEIERRLEKEHSFSIDLLQSSAMIIQKFIEQYHEKLEEEYIFPKVEKEMGELVQVLKEQHEKGRLLTHYILTNATQEKMHNPDTAKKLKETLHEFIVMYRPHEAREDTVLFPFFKSTITQQEYDSLGDLFEKREHALFGEDGFEKMVAEVARIEKALGIYKLSEFTPSALSI